MASWVRGWALARETAPPEPHGDGFRIEVGWPDQARRYLFPHVSDEIARLGAEVRSPWVYLKACAPPEALRAVLPPAWSVADARFMMTLDDLDRPKPLSPHYRVRVDEAPAGAAAKVTAGGALAAGGRVVTVGEVAVASAPNRRRTGAPAARTRHGGDGRPRPGGPRSRRPVLVATAEGRRLYEALGWRLHALYASAVIIGP